MKIGIGLTLAVITALWCSLVFAGERYVRDPRYSSELVDVAFTYRLADRYEREDEVWLYKDCTIIERNKALPVLALQSFERHKADVVVRFTDKKLSHYHRVFCK